MADGKTIQFRIMSTADLKGIDQLINKLNQLQRTAAQINRSMSTANSAATNLDRITRSANAATTGMTRMGSAATTASAGVTRLSTASTTAATGATRLGASTTTAATGATRLGTAATTAATGATRLGTATTATTTATTRFSSVLGSLSSRFASVVSGLSRAGSALSTMTGRMSGFVSAIMRGVNALSRFASAIASALSGGLKRAAGYISSFTSSAASMFAGLRRALDGTGNLFQRFSQRVQQSMQAAQRAVREFYSAGWSMLTSGYMAQNFGERIGRGLMGSLTRYMDYEKLVTKTAIAGSGEMGGQTYAADTEAVEEIIRLVQRGSAEDGIAPVYQFGHSQLAEGIYYYSSALGLPIVSEGPNRNIEPIASQVSNLMALAAITGTGVESATKGVMNIALQFGIDPRNPANSEMINTIAAQVGLLSNVSTMEVPDIFETMKMVGPMAHLLSGGGGGRNVGAGLNDMFALAFLASEMGSRGGLPGRGFAAGFVSMLDPTDKMIEVAGQYFGTGGTEEGYRDVFLDPETGGLKGGIPGLIKTLMTVPINQQAEMISAMYTNAATRAFLTSTLAAPGAYDDMVSLMESDNPVQWLSEALLKTNDTIVGNFQNLKNAWFDVQSSIVKSVEGPLKGAFKSIADVVWDISDTIRANPWLGQLISGIASFVSMGAILVGSMLMIGGTILLIMQAFSRLGAVAAPFRAIFLGIASSIMTAIPMFLLLATIGGLIYGAWSSDFMGIQTLITGLFDSIGGTSGVVGMLEQFVQGLRNLGLAFSEFFNGIIFGQGSLTNLGALLQSVFGPLLGNAIFGQMLRLQQAFTGFRDSLKNVGDSASRFGTVFKNMGLAFQGFLEQVFLGKQRIETVMAQDALGKALGIDNLSVKLRGLSVDVRRALVGAYNVFREFAGLVVNQIRRIRDNLGQIFTVNNFMTALRAFGAFMQGIFIGIGTGIYAAVTAVEIFTRALANAGNAGRWIADLVQQFTGLEMTLEGVARALGVAFGAIIGMRVFAFMTPLIGLFARLTPMILSAGLAMSQFGIMAAGALASFVLQIGAAVAGVFAFLFSFGGLIAIFTGWVAVFSGVGVAMFAVTAATQGLGAAMTGLVNFFQGVWDGTILVRQGLMALAGAIIEAVQWMMQLSGTATDFYTVGAMLGVAITGLVIAVTAFGMAMTAAFLISNPLILGIAAISIAIMGLSLVFAMVVADAGMFKSSLMVVFLSLAEALKPIFEGIANLFIDAMNLAIQVVTLNFESFVNVFDGLLGLAGIEVDMSKTVGDWLSFEHVDLDATWIQEMRTAITDDMEASGVQSAESWMQGFFTRIEGTPLGDTLNNMLTNAGLDPNNLDFTQIEWGELLNVGELDSIMSEFDAMDMTFMDSITKEYFDALSDWERWVYDVEILGEQMAKTKWTDMGWEIPTDPGSLGDWYMEAAEGVDEGGATLEEALLEANQAAFDAMKGLSVEDAVSKTFNWGLGKGGQSVGAMFMQFGEQIRKNAGDVPWFDMNELLADAAINGQLDTDTAGQNLHNALAPALEVTAQQLGVSVESLLVDIPKYFAPPELVPMATAEFMNNLNQIPKEVGLAIDTLGAGVWNDVGVQWTDVINYGTSMAAQGMEWDFVDFLVETYGIARDEAEAALLAMDVPFDVIGNQWFESTERFALSLGGDIQVLDQAMYDVAQSLTAGADNMVIAISESDLQALPTEVKYYLDSLGYTFLLDDTATDVGVWKDGIVSAVNDIDFAEFNALDEEVQSFLNDIGVAFSDDGIPVMAWDWLQRLTAAVDTEVKWNALPESVRAFLTSIGWEFENANTANQVSAWGDEVAQAAFDAAAKIAEAMRLPTNPADGGITGQWFPTYGETPDTTWSGYMPRSVGDYSSYLDQLGAGSHAGSGGLGPNQVQGPEVKFTADTSEVSQAATEVTNEINNISTAKVKVEVDFQHFSGSMSDLLVTLDNAFSGIGENMKLKINLDTEDVKTQLNNVLGTGGGGEGAAQAVPYKVKIMPDLTEFTSWMNTIQTHYSNVGIKVKIEADLTAFTSWMNTIQTHYGNVGIKVKIEPDLTEFMSWMNTLSTFFDTSPIKVKLELDIADLNSQRTMLPGAGKEDDGWKISVGFDLADTSALDAVQTTLTALATTWTIVLRETGSSTVSGQITNLTNLARGLAVTWTASIRENGAGTVSSALSHLLDLLGSYATTWTATIAINNYATGVVQDAINILNDFDGMSATATMTTYKQSINLGGSGSNTQELAKGGYVRSRYQLVGEEGPELVALPFGSYVNNADTTNRLFDSLGTGMSLEFEAPRSGDVRAARSYMPITADPTFRMPQSQSRTYQRSEHNEAPVQVHIHHLEIAREVDVEKAMREIDSKMGRKIELVQRGQDAMDSYNNL